MKNILKILGIIVLSYMIILCGIEKKVVEYNLLEKFSIDSVWCERIYWISISVIFILLIGLFVKLPWRDWEYKKTVYKKVKDPWRSN